MSHSGILVYVSSMGTKKTRRDINNTAERQGIKHGEIEKYHQVWGNEYINLCGNCKTPLRFL